MADNIVLNAGVGGATLATDDIGGNVHAQFIKLMDGTLDGTEKVAATAANGLDVDVTRVGGNVTVINGGVFLVQAAQSGAWTVTADAGVNLNTSLLALEAGGNLAAAVTSLQIIDDWDDANYCNVNLNLAGTDVTAGAGAVAAGTPRFTLASDDPAVTALQLLDNSVDGNYLNVNANIAGTDVAANTGAVNAQTQRITIATDDAAITALQLLDNAVDGNYLNVNLNLAGTDVTAGAGAVAAGTPRFTLASDDPAVTALQLLDNSVDGNYLNVNLNVAGTDIAAGTGVDNAQTLRVSLATDIALPAGTNTHGGVISQPSTTTAYSGSTSCTVVRISTVTSTDGSNLVAASVGKRFRFLSFAIMAETSTVTNFWLEDSDGTDVFGDSGGIPLQTTGASGAAGLVLQYNPHGWFDTPTANKDLHIKLTAAQTVAVLATYIEF